MRHKWEGIFKTLYRKDLESDEHRSKVLNFAMRFQASSYNFGLKAGRDEPSKPFSAFRLSECDLDGEDVQYGPDDLLVQKPFKTSASKTPTSKTSVSPAYAPQGPSLSSDLGEAHNLPYQVTTNFTAVNAQISPLDDVVVASLSLKANHVSAAISEIEPDLASELASSKRAQE